MVMAQGEYEQKPSTRELAHSERVAREGVARKRDGQHRSGLSKHCREGLRFPKIPGPR